ncbi:MAG: site-specific integrase [Deltaproteobacteria bacterium]|nr:site-specific integrase [Deltaproteobacteria bacterium]
MAEVKELPAQRTPPNFLTRADAGRFLAGIEDPDKRRFVAAALATGRRIGELIGLRWERVDLNRGRYLVVKSKNHLTRSYPINSTFRAVLVSTGPEASGPVWPRWTDRRYVSRWIKAELVKAGFPNLRAHDLRHSYASIQAMAGRSLQEIKELLGHSQISTTLIYAHLTPDHLAEAAEIQLGPIDLEGKTK